MKLIITTSFKGGVGKSLISINVAFGLMKLGYRVGLLDSDIAMPALTKYLNLEDTEIETHEMTEPFDFHGIQVLSAGMFMDKDQPVVIGAEKREALIAQFIDKTNWNVDYLVIDTPPGSEDELHHVVKTRKQDLKGVIVVTTPSSVAITQVRRSLELFKRMKVPVLGIIGNMTSFECSSCHKVTSIFADGQANPIENLADDFKVKVLATLPMYSGVDHDPLHFVEQISGGLKLAKI
jgi:ATP-binding protein involved in chromosome partitioning